MFRVVVGCSKLEFPVLRCPEITRVSEFPSPRTRLPCGCLHHNHTLGEGDKDGDRGRHDGLTLTLSPSAAGKHKRPTGNMLPVHEVYLSASLGCLTASVPDVS